MTVSINNQINLLLSKHTLSRGIPTGSHVVADWKDFSHKPCPLNFSWENLRVLTLTEIGGCGGYQRHTVTLGSQQWPHTRILLCFGPLLQPLPLPSSTDGLLSSLSVLGVCCGLTGLQTTAGNCTVFPLPDFEPPDSQRLHSRAASFS